MAKQDKIQEASHNQNACAPLNTFIPFDYGNPLFKSERNLPHWQQDSTTYFITFRLADSIPLYVVKRIKFERVTWLSQHSAPYTEDEWHEYNELFSNRIHNLLDSGSGSCILKDKEISDIVKNALLYFEGERYKLGECIIMPNHVHVLVTPINKWHIEKITHTWKSFTANKINTKMNTTGTIWQHESYDHIVRTKKELNLIAQYIINN